MSIVIAEQLDWLAIEQLINKSKSILLVTHKKPDGDAIGSLVGLGLALQQHKKQITLLVDDGAPEKFSFLEGSDKVQDFLENNDLDLIIALDASDINILGEVGKAVFLLDAPKIVIDHHATNDLFGTYHLVSSGYVSTTEIILELLERLGWSLNAPIANALMLGVVTDTQAFRYGPITAQTFGNVQKLMAHNVDLRGIIERMLVSIPHNQLKLTGLGLTNATLEEHVIWSWITIKELVEHGLDPAQSAPLSDELLKDENAYISVFFRETKTGDVRAKVSVLMG